MRYKNGTIRLTPAGVAVLIAIILFIGSILYATFQPKQVEYIYREIERFVTMYQQADRPVLDIEK
jgi:hypothetical protein